MELSTINTHICLQTMGMGVQPASTNFPNNLHTFSRFIYIILKYNSYVYFVLYQRYGTGYSSAIIVWLVKR